ncbi:MAG: hypothetical protein SVE93_01050 [Candidatus Thermoplasmatota archaeon]|nr:hypothetical protein [Candidatus Thermoplasmatota archaeon]
MGSSNKIKVLLDTNMLLSLFRFNVALDEDSDLFVTESVVNELRSMHSQNAKAALSFVQDRCKVIESLSTFADRDLLEIASMLDCVLATNDRELRREARAKGIRTACLRGKKKIVFD